MNTKEYFRKLIALYEAANQEEEVLSPAEEVEEQPATEVPAEETPQAVGTSSNSSTGDGSGTIEDPGLDDANYLSGEESIPAPTNGTANVSEREKLVKIFDLLSELMNYSRTFNETLEGIDLNLLDKEKNEKLNLGKRRLVKVSEKLSHYIKEVFPDEKYEKALYVYILLRTEFVTVIRSLRELLELNKTDSQETDKKQQKP
jgi:hypothetical protein